MSCRCRRASPARPRRAVEWPSDDAPREPAAEQPAAGRRAGSREARSRSRAGARARRASPSPSRSRPAPRRAATAPRPATPGCARRARPVGRRHRRRCGEGAAEVARRRRLRWRPRPRLPAQAPCPLTDSPTTRPDRGRGPGDLRARDAARARGDRAGQGRDRREGRTSSSAARSSGSPPASSSSSACSSCSSGIAWLALRLFFGGRLLGLLHRRRRAVPARRGLAGCLAIARAFKGAPPTPDMAIDEAKRIRETLSGEPGAARAVSRARRPRTADADAHARARSAPRSSPTGPSSALRSSGCAARSRELTDWRRSSPPPRSRR